MLRLIASIAIVLFWEAVLGPAARAAPEAACGSYVPPATVPSGQIYCVRQFDTGDTCYSTPGPVCAYWQAEILKGNPTWSVACSYSSPSGSCKCTLNGSSTRTFGVAGGPTCPSGYSLISGTNNTCKLNPDQSRCPTDGSPDPYVSVGSGVDSDAGGGSCEESDPVLVGNPVNAKTGNKYLQEVDYVGFGPFPLAFVRHYNSEEVPMTSLGPRWRHHYDRQIIVEDSTHVAVVRPDGRAFEFAAAGEEWTSPSSLFLRLRRIAGGWEVTTSQDEIETYNTAGQLTRLQDRSGLAQSLVYSDASTPYSVAPDAGLLLRVTHSTGAQLSFTYSAARRIDTMSDPAGNLYRFSYDTYKHLKSVTYPGSSAPTVRTYLYAHAAGTNPKLAHALTGIQDEAGETFATYAYDTAGRAISSEHAGGADKVSLTFSASKATATSTTEVKDALGTTRTYAFQIRLGQAKVSSLSQPCSACGGSAFASTDYDSNGLAQSHTDFGGTLTTYLRSDLYGRTDLETSRTEAAGSALTRTITTEWHPTHRLAKRVAEPLRITTYAYDSFGHPTSVSVRPTKDLNGSLGFGASPAGSARTWTFNHAYDALTPGLVIRTVVNGPRTDVADQTTSEYYASDHLCSGASPSGCRGQLKSITNAAGHTTWFNQYNAHGQTELMQDPNGLLIYLSYDARQRLTSRQVGSELTRYDYWPTGLLKQITFPDGLFVTFAYDAAHRLIRVQDNLGNRIEYSLDTLGNRIREEVYDSAGALTERRQREYDTLNRLAKRLGGSDPDTQITHYGYDAQGNLLTLRDPLDHLTRNGYDALNRLVSITDPGSGLTQVTYDGLDQITRVVDPRNVSTTYKVNGLGDLASNASPDTGTTTYIRNVAGDATSVKYPGTTAWKQSYDALGRLSAISYQVSGLPNATFEYDGAGTGAPNAKGRLTRIVDESGETAWSYDLHGRVTAKSQVTRDLAIASPATHTVDYTYDATGRLSTITYPSGLIITYTYDAGGRVSALRAGSKVVLSAVRYHPFGRVAGFTWDGGQTYTRAFDLDGRVRSYTSGTSTRTLSYDAAGRITAIEDSVSPSLNATFGYDALDRLTSYVGHPGNQAYSYDANGNRTSVTIGAASYAYSVATTSNRLASTKGPAPARKFAYNADGRIKSDAVFSFSYTGHSRLRKVTRLGVGTTTEYRYNALGQRTIKKGQPDVVTRFVYDEAGRLLGEYNNDTPVQEYIYLGDMPVATRVAGGASIYHIWVDHLDTPLLVASPSGTAVWRWDSAPFGDILPDQSPSGGAPFTLNLRFPGQYFDVETGLHYNYHRDYDPQTGRYIQSDPIGLRGGLNPYAYVYDDPVRFADPFGLDVRVCFYPGGVTHVGFGIVPESGTFGFYPRSRSPVAPGEVRPDPQDEPRYCKTVPSNQDQDQCMTNCRLRRAANPGWYHLTRRQCTSFVRDCMRECGIPTGIDSGRDVWQGPRPDRFYQTLPGEAISYP